MKYEIFLQWNTKFSPSQKVLDVLDFGSCPNCMNSANIVIEIQFKLLNEKTGVMLLKVDSHLEVAFIILALLFFLDLQSNISLFRTLIWPLHVVHNHCIMLNWPIEIFTPEADLRKCSWEKVFWKYAAN